MEENKNLWNKQMNELTVKDVIVIKVVVPALAVGSFVAIGAVYAASEKVVSKIQNFRLNRKINKLEKDN